MTSNNNQDGQSFSPPVHLYSDPIALSGFLAEHFPDEMEVVAVTAENIEEMETAAGFPMPEEYVDFWLEKGSIFFSKDEFVFALYCYNAEGVNGNSLHGILTFWQNFKRRTFSLLDNEKTFLTKCCWVLAMIMEGDQMLLIVADPLGVVHGVHFSSSLRTISEEEFEQALLPVLQAKIALKAFMSSEAYLAVTEEPSGSTTEAEDDSEEDDNAAEEAETRAFLEKHGIKEVTYEEALTALNVENLYDYWDEDADDSISDDYESERAYFEDFGSFYFCNGDLTIDGDLAIPHRAIHLIVVNGNMTINGKISEYTAYYVTVNTTVDYLALGNYQKTVGLETVRYVASAWGEDDEVVHTMSFRTINAPYFFSWFYDLACFEFAPETLITALYNYDDLSAYETDNAILMWHDYAYAFKPELYYQVEQLHYDVLNMNIRSFYETLKSGTAVLQEGVTLEAIKLTRKGVRLNKEGDAAGAYQHFKDAFTKAPGYYLAYYYAGKCLFDKKAYAQAKELFAKGIPLTPEKLLYEARCKEFAEKAAARAGEGSAVTLDWDTKRQVSTVKDQPYWNQFFTDMLGKYGPDLYKRTGKFPSEWLSAKLVTIPIEYRSKEMLQMLLDHTTNGELDVDGQMIKLFKPELYTAAIFLQAVKRNNPCRYQDIPAEFITEAIWLVHPQGIDLSYIPKEHLTYELCFKAVAQSQYNYRYVPEAFKDERMNIALIAGGCLNSFPVKELPSHYYTAEYVKQAVELGIHVIKRIPPKLIDKEVYTHAVEKYGQHPEWPSIVEEFNRKPTFSYDTFDKVWACFWDENFIIKAITSNDRNNCERIYDVPKQYLTQKICDVAVERNSYDFEFVPREFVTQEMCEKACSRDYGSALEFVPLPMRNNKVCEKAVTLDEANIKFVPLALRVPALCAAVVTRNNDLTKYLPHEHYSAVFEILSEKYKNRFTPDYLLLHIGLGLIIDKKYEDARTKLAEVEAVKSAETVYIHQAAYYTGWSYFLEGNTAKAKEYFKKSQEFAKAQKINDREWLTYAYATFQLPEVNDVYEFSKSAFDEQMREASLLVQNKEYTKAIDVLARAEKLLTDAQSSEMRLWAYVWDHQRYALYEAGKKEESLALCKKTIDTLSKITLWDYLEEFNPVRAALRAAHNNLAYRCYETASDLKGVEEGLKHIKVTMKTIAPIEDKSVLNQFYETHALLLYKAMGFDAAYQKDFDKVVARISKLKLREEGLLTNEFLQLIKL